MCKPRQRVSTRLSYGYIIPGVVAPLSRPSHSHQSSSLQRSTFFTPSITLLTVLAVLNSCVHSLLQLHLVNPVHMFNLLTHSSRPGTTTASAVVWLQAIPALFNLLTPVLASHPNNLILHDHKLLESAALKPAPAPQTSIWSHYNTISGFNFFDSFTFINRWDVS